MALHRWQQRQCYILVGALYAPLLFIPWQQRIYTFIITFKLKANNYYTYSYLTAIWSHYAIVIIVVLLPENNVVMLHIILFCLSAAYIFMHFYATNLYLIYIFMLEYISIVINLFDRNFLRIRSKSRKNFKNFKTENLWWIIFLKVGGVWNWLPWKFLKQQVSYLKIPAYILSIKYAYCIHLLLF